MAVSDYAREFLTKLDVKAFHLMWSRVFPHIPPPQNEDGTLIALHQARTMASSIPMSSRLYSHAWLMERGMRSDLPEELRPEKDIRPTVIVEAVGVAVGTTSSRPDRREEAKEIERVMANAAGAAMEAGIRDPKEVSARMWEARKLYTEGKIKREL